VSFLSDRPNLADAALQCCLLSMRVQKHQKHKGDSPRGAKVAGERPRPLPEGILSSPILVSRLPSGVVGKSRFEASIPKVYYSDGISEKGGDILTLRDQRLVLAR
jgi:hypothetical protein